MIPGRQYSVSSVLQLVRNSLPLLLVLAVAGAIAGRLYVRRIPDVFRSEAVILVQPQLVPQSFVRSTVTQTLDERLRSMDGRVRGPEQLGRIASELQVYGGVDTDLAVRAMTASSAVGVVKSDAFRVAFVHRNPVMAASVAQRLAQAFVDENLRTRAGLADETNQFMDAQLERTRQQLTEHEHKLETYRRTYAGQLPSQLSSNLQGIQTAQTRLRAIEEAIQQDRDRKLKLDQLIASLTVDSDQSQNEPAPSDTSAKEPVPDIDPFKDQILELRGREALRQIPRVQRTLQALELQLKPDHPDIIRLKRVISELERRVMADLGPDALNRRPDDSARVEQQRAGTLEKLRGEASSIDERLAKRETEEQQLDAAIRKYQDRVELIPTRETELTTLMRDYDTLRDTYRSLLAKKQEAQMASELERRNVGESFKIVEPAKVPTRPFAPDRFRFLMAGCGLGIAVGLLLTMWREYRNETLRTEREIVAGLGLPVIAFLPIIPTASERLRVRKRRLILSASATGLVLGAVLLFYLRMTGRL